MSSPISRSAASTAQPRLSRIYDQIAADTAARTVLTRGDLSRTFELLLDEAGCPYLGEGMSLQILLDQPGGRQITWGLAKFQELLSRQLDSVAIFLHPVNSMHVTVFPFYSTVQAHKPVLSREDLIQVDRVVAAEASFQIQFRRLLLVKGDIILEGLVEAPAIPNIRAELARIFPDGLQPTVLIHVSVARVLQELGAVGYRSLKDFVAKHEDMASGTLEVLEMSITRHFDSVCTCGQYERIRLSPGSEPNSIARGLRRRQAPFRPGQTIVVACRPVHQDDIARLLRSCEHLDVVTAWHAPGGRLSVKGTLAGQRTKVIVYALAENVDGTVCAAARSLAALRELQRSYSVPDGPSYVILAGGKSTRNLALAPRGCKALIPLPGGRTLIELTLENIRGISDDPFAGTLITVCDELHLIAEPLRFGTDRFSLVCDRLHLTDPYIETCGCCAVGADGTLVAFYEKRPASELAALFGPQEKIVVSFGPYYLPASLHDAFIDCFTRETFGEFSKMIEASLSDNQDSWLAGNPDYTQSFARASSRFLAEGGSYNTYIPGTPRLSAHLGSNAEYYKFCMSLFDDAAVRSVLGILPDPHERIVEPSAVLPESVRVGRRAIICGSTRIERGEIGDGAILIDVRAERAEIAKGSLVTYSRATAVNTEPNFVHGMVSVGQEKEVAMAFPVRINVKRDSRLLAVAMSV